MTAYRAAWDILDEAGGAKAWLARFEAQMAVGER